MATGGGTNPRDWDWRVSVADIAENGPFSIFPKMDRHLTLIEGRGLVLRGASGSMRLAGIGDSIAFPGEQTLDVELIDGPVRVWNVMVRRGVINGAVCLVSGTCATRRLQVQSRVVLVLEGDVSIADPAALDETFRAGHGFVRVDGGGLLAVTLSGTILRTDIHRGVMQL